MKIKDKAFTLVELLGVITLLGIIILIITPNLVNIQKKSSKDVFKNSVNTLLRNAQIYYGDNDFTNYPKDGLSAFSPDLNIKNRENFTDGTVNLIDNSYFFANNVSNGKYCASGRRNDLVITTGACPELPYTCFEFDDNSGTITKYKSELGECKLKNITIPDKIDGVPVKNIGVAAFANYEYFNCFNDSNNYTLNDVMGSIQCTASIGTKDKNEYPNVITSVFLPSTIESIGNNAFANNDIQTVNLSDLYNLKNIGAGAFANNKIKTIDFSENKNLKQIGYGSFISNEIDSIILTGADSLETIWEFAFSNNFAKELKISGLPSLIEIKGSSFSDNEINDLYLENLPKLNNIRGGAFESNNIDNLIIKDLPLLSGIGFLSFSACKATNIELINLPELSEIAAVAFPVNKTEKLTMKGLDKLKTIKFSTFVNSFSKETSSDFDLSNLVNLKTIESNAFNGNNFDSITIPANVTEIQEDAFKPFYGHTIKSVTIQGDNPKRFNSNWTYYGFPENLMPQ